VAGHWKLHSRVERDVQLSGKKLDIHCGQIRRIKRFSHFLLVGYPVPSREAQPSRRRTRRKRRNAECRLALLAFSLLLLLAVSSSLEFSEKSLASN
jgi:hypothetical protein